MAASVKAAVQGDKLLGLNLVVVGKVMFEAIALLVDALGKTPEVLERLEDEERGKGARGEFRDSKGNARHVWNISHLHTVLGMCDDIENLSGEDLAPLRAAGQVLTDCFARLADRDVRFL